MLRQPIAETIAQNVPLDTNESQALKAAETALMRRHRRKIFAIEREAMQRVIRERLRVKSLMN